MRTSHSNLRVIVHRTIQYVSFRYSIFIRISSFFRNFLSIVYYHIGRTGSSSRGVPCDIGEIKIADFECPDGLLELFLGFSGKSHDDIGRYGKEGIMGPEVLDLKPEILESMLPVHASEYFI